MPRQSRQMQSTPIPYVITDEQPKIELLPTGGRSSTNNVYK